MSVGITDNNAYYIKISCVDTETGHEVSQTETVYAQSAIDAERAIPKLLLTISQTGMIVKAGHVWSLLPSRQIKGLKAYLNPVVIPRNIR